MALDSLRSLYVDQLRDLYSAENQMLRAIPDVIDNIRHPELRSAFEEHRTDTEEQVRRLEGIFRDLGERPQGHHSKGMEGIIREGQDLLRDDANPDVLDAAMIAAAQRIEHYEIAGYGCARTYARMLGLDDHARALQRTLDEEGSTDARLTRLAEEVVNPDAERGEMR